MPSNPLFSLSLCRKAGALVQGFEAVKESAYDHTAQLVLCASDVSEGTARRVRTFCERSGTPFATLALGQDDLLAVTKKRAGVFAVTNPELAKLFSKEERPCP